MSAVAPAYPPPGGAPPAYGYAQGQQPQYGQPQYGQQQYGMGTQPQSNVVVIQTHQQRGMGNGNCPNCGNGYLRSQYTLIGLIILILFFPLGIICCLMMTEKRCTSCNAKF